MNVSARASSLPPVSFKLAEGISAASSQAVSG
jgi:hypothetical protein